MKVTQALVEIKKLDKQIDKLCRTSKFIGLAQQGYINGFKSVTDAQEVFTSGLNRIRSLQERRANIKAKLTASNAVTKVTIGNTEMTVAEAIERKNSIEQDKLLYAVIAKQYADSQTRIAANKDRIEAAVDSKVNQIFGNQKKVEMNDTTVLSIRKQVEEDMEMKLVDPNNLAVAMEKLADSIETFESDVDVVLSISNATTDIDVE